MKYVVITGVSTGIGYGAAKQFAEAGYHVFGSVRKSEDATRLKAEIGTNFTPLLFDVTDRPAIEKAAELVKEIVGNNGIVGLINNAGMATSGPLVHQPIEEIRLQFEVNVIGQINVIQVFFELLKAGAKPGKIINISSSAGKISAPFFGAYAGSKHALEGISNSLRRELQLYGIDVIIVGPGAVKTAIWDKDSTQQLAKKYAETDYAASLDTFQKYILNQGKNGLSEASLGEFIQEVFEIEKPKTRYSILGNRFKNWIIPRLLPDRWFDKQIAKSIGLLRK
ncbi:MAG: SDR family NAD(P)-dependent oxidoreductase [Prochloraceae cyanobacterium]